MFFKKLALLCIFLIPFFSHGSEVENVIILGSGPAGLTAAIYTGQAHLKPLVVKGKEFERQLSAVNLMENFPGFPQGISGEELVLNLHSQAEKFGARFQEGHITAVDFLNSPFSIHLDNGEVLQAKTIIVAVGSKKRGLDLESEKRLMGKGIARSATYEAELFKQKKVSVVGGGDSAVEEALTLAGVAESVFLIYRGKALTASPYLQERVYKSANVHVLLEFDVKEVLGEDKVEGLLLQNLNNKNALTIDCEGVFVSIGRSPNTDFFKGQLEMSSQGLIKVKSPSSKTSIEGVFAAGDVMDGVYRKAVTASASGAIAGLDVVNFLKR